MNTVAKKDKRRGKFRDGFAIAKSAWQVLKLDKELVGLQVISAAIATLLVGASVFLIVLLAANGIDLAAWQTWQQIGAGIAAYLVFSTILTFIVNIFSGAIIHGASQRFNGNDPTIKSSLKGSWAQWRPLALFSLMMATIGLILQLAEEHIPLAGKIAVWLLGAAWSIANVFAVPVIVLSDKKVTPIGATKESVAVIKKVWGQGVGASIGIGFVAALSIVIYLSLASVAIALTTLLDSTGIMLAGVGISILGLLVLILIFSTLSAIAKAALYDYATTGEAPELFSKRLLHDAITPKKARKIFA